MSLKVMRVALPNAILLIIFFLPQAFAQCLTVTPTGSGSHSGADWNNALIGGNLKSLVTRGNIYYLAGGAYDFDNGFQVFSTPDSGTKTITIRAATAADNGVGSGCGSAGWSTALAASGSNQVVFRCDNCLSSSFGAHLQFTTDYWILDGNDPGRTAVSDDSSDYNMKIDNSWHGGARDGSGLGFHVRVGSNGNPVHDITLRYIEFAGTGLDAMNVDPQAIASISCVNPNTAQIQLAGQRNHAYLFVGEWVTIGGTANHLKDTADTLSAGPQQVGSTTNGQMTSCSNTAGRTAVCTMASYVPTISTDGTQVVTIASNSVANYNGTWPVTGINLAAKTISVTLATSGNAAGTGGNLTWNGSVGVQIQSVTNGGATCAPSVPCSTDWTQPFTVAGNGYTCSGGPESTGMLAGPDAEAGGGIDMVDGVTNGTFNYSYGHDGIFGWNIGGDTSITIQGNACERGETHAISPFHSSCLAGDSPVAGSSNSSTSNLTFAYNRDIDQEGSGDVGALNRIQPNTLTSSNWNFYGNVWGFSDGNPFRRGSEGSGEVFCINTGMVCSNWKILNNTIVGDGTAHQTHWGFINSLATTNNVICENNLGYNSTQSNGTWSNDLCTTIDHNTFINLGTNAPVLSLLDFLVSSAISPFVSSGTHNYQLTSETVLPNLNNGLSTSAFLPANNLDPNGVTRGTGGNWDRGAFQFGAPTVRPNAPTVGSPVPR